MKQREKNLTCPPHQKIEPTFATGSQPMNEPPANLITEINYNFKSSTRSILN